jgi:anthranilate synthase component 1
MKYCNRFSYNTFKKKNAVSVIYSIEERAKINKINLFIDNVLNKKNSFIFESVEKAKNRGRYTIFGFNPDLILEVKKNNIYLNKRKIKNKQNPKKYLEKFINNFKFKLPNNLPKMSMMMAGYLGYDFIRYFEKIPDKNNDDLKIPDVKLIRPNFVYIHDNKLHKFFYIKISFNKNSSYDIELKNLKEQLKKDLSKNEINKTNFEIKKSNNNVRSNISKQKFIKIVNKAKKYIASGDIFQVVLSQRFEKNLGKNPLDIYKKIRLTNPSPFLYYFNFSNFQIIGSSPEILVRIKDKKITIRPIAGTRKRGKNKIQDLRLVKSLLNDPKELSEHLMLLDLGRNDVGRAAEDGSVKVDEKFKIEKYSHVMHIVSNVFGKFKNSMSVLDGLLCGFPAGTVSGAPKIRAMEIIDELENKKRKLYAGGVGYFSGNGDMDTCIALRTALVKNKKIYVQAGAGIVADSVPIKEYYETVNKAKALLEAAK